MTLPNSLTQKHPYTNVLESLVEAEVQLQVKALPGEIRRFVRPIEVMTYALNRLHPLYACSETGVKAQRQKAISLYGAEIAQAVTWGIRAVQNDPLRRFHPLRPNEPIPSPQELAAIDSIRSLLEDPSITRETLGERIHSSLEAKKNHEFNRRIHTCRAESQEDVAPADPQPTVSWKEYKNRRSLSERKNIHLLRSTGGAVGNLRLMG